MSSTSVWNEINDLLCEASVKKKLYSMGILGVNGLKASMSFGNIDASMDCDIELEKFRDFLLNKNIVENKREDCTHVVFPRHSKSYMSTKLVEQMACMAFKENAIDSWDIKQVHLENGISSRIDGSPYLVANNLALKNVEEKENDMKIGETCELEPMNAIHFDNTGVSVPFARYHEHGLFKGEPIIESPLNMVSLAEFANNLDNAVKNISRKMSKFTPEISYYNDKKKQFVIKWTDETETRITLQDADTFDLEKAVALCFMKKALGNKSGFNYVLNDCMANAQGNLPKGKKKR